MRLLLTAFIVLGLTGGDVSPSWAQQQPVTQPRVTGGLFGGLQPVDPNHPDRPSQQVTLNLDVAGGYDKNSGLEDGSFVGTDVQQTGAIATTAAEFGYRLGTSRNYLDASARANASLAKVGVDQRGAGDAVIQSAVTMGRRAGLGGGLSVAYEPTYLFNAFGGLASEATDGVVPGTTLTEGFTEHRWLSTRGFGSIHRNWTPRQRSDGDYSKSQRKPITGEGLDSYSQSAGFRHNWSYRERQSLEFVYQFDENRQVGDTTDLLPLRTHRVGLNMRLERRVAPNRAVAVHFGGGATRSRTSQTAEVLPVDFVVPSGSAGVELTLSARWSMSLDANRNVTVLEGLSPQPFNTNSVSLLTEGRVGRKVEITATGAYAHGAQSSSDTGAFETTMAMTELRYLLSRRCALTTTYSYYDHILFDVETLDAGFPSRHRRNSIRFGVSFWLPLFGSFRE